MSSLVQRIRDEQQQAATLEPDSVEREKLFTEINGCAEEFLQTIYQTPAWTETKGAGVGLYDSPIREEPGNIREIVNNFKQNVLSAGLNPAAPGHMAYIPACSMYASALGDFLAAITNRFSGDFSASPGAVRMENQVLGWLATLMGYPAGAAGNLTSGGSVAALTSFVTARNATGIKSKDYAKAVVYLSEHTHHCADKALHIAGMGEAVLRRVELDDEFCMRPDSLEALIRQDKEQGLVPWMVTSSAGTTNFGNVDPLDDIGAVARQYGLWYHVDCAYGGFFKLTDIAKHLFTGVERSNSLIMDPHKGMFLPFGTGAVLVRDQEQLYRAHFHTADYLQDSMEGKEELSPSDLGIELSRHFRALRFWLPLQVSGVAPFRAALTEKILLTRYAYERLNEMPGFEVVTRPHLSIFVFRYVPGQGDVDEFNRRLLSELRDDGRIFISSTKIDGHFMLRFAVLSMRTHLETIELAISLLRQKAEFIETL